MDEPIQPPTEQEKKEYIWEDFLKLRGSSKKKTSWEEYRKAREEVGKNILQRFGL